MIGPQVSQLNRDLLTVVGTEQPELLFCYRGTHIFPETLRAIRRVCPNITLLGYNNDDPFSPEYPPWKWRHFIGCLPEYDLMLAYRAHNLAEYRAAGVKRVRLLRSWYIPERNRPVELTAEEKGRYECEIVFVGHFEDDHRVECLERIAKRGWRLRIYGHTHGWDRALRQSKVLQKFLPLRTVWGDEYNKVLCGAKIALCFLSKLNRDTYTRRCFEIPAAGTLLLSEYTSDLAGMFEPDREAAYFSSPEQLMTCLEKYLSNDELRTQVAAAGHQRVAVDGHDVLSRMRQVLNWVYELRGDELK
jgi:spore maturation protein CgeB